MKIVYLDSQDYSVLSDSQRKTPDHERIASAIRAAAAQGSHSFPFSSLLVQEAVHNDEASRAMAVERARLMKEFSRSTVLPPFEHVVRIEVAQARARREGGAPRDYRVELRTDGVWWPWETLKSEGPLDFKSEMLNLAEKEFGKLNRLARRQMAKNLKGAEHEVDRQMPELLAWIKANFPNSSEVAKPALVRRFLLGTMDQGVFFDRVMTAALELETYIAWTVDKMAGGQKVVSYFKVTGYDMVTRISGLLAQIHSSPESFANEPIREAGIAKVCESIRHGIIKAGARWLATHEGTSDEAADALAIRISADPKLRMPGIDTVVASFRAWLEIITDPNPTRQKTKRSDALDVLHAVYLPYVDHFRTDTRFANVLKVAKVDNLHKVVPRLDELPRRLGRLV